MFKCTRKETVLLFALGIVSLTSIVGNTFLLVHGGSSSLHLYKHVIISFNRGEISGGYKESSLLEASTPSLSNSPSSREQDEHPDTVSTASSNTVSVANISSTTHPTSKARPVSVKRQLTQTKCHTPHCSQFLSVHDKNRLYACMMTVFDKVRYFEEPIQLDEVPENNCDFINGTGRDPVALASPPGSGNTWVRGLLERATGFCTGYNNCDYAMRMRGFVGENINSGSVLVVKTHMDEPHWIGGRTRLRNINSQYASFSSGIVLLRNPYHSLIAEWSRNLAEDKSQSKLMKKYINVSHYDKHTHKTVVKKEMVMTRSRKLIPSDFNSHTNVATKETWFSEDWDKFVHDYLRSWLSLIKNWVLKQTPSHSVLVVKYENLKRDTVTEVGRMMTFLGVPFDSEVVTQRLAGDFTDFKRPHNNQTDFDHYTKSQLLRVKDTVKEAINQIEKRKMNHLIELDEYLDVF